MEVEFEEESLRRLAQCPTDPGAKYDAHVIRNFRKKLQVLASSPDEADLRALQSLELKERRGRYSVRLDEQFCMRFRMRTENGERIVTVTDIAALNRKEEE